MKIEKPAIAGTLESSDCQVTVEAGEGTGLGLALAEQIVVSHKGFIYAESELGTGSAFHVILPIMKMGDEEKIVSE